MLQWVDFVGKGAPPAGGGKRELFSAKGYQDPRGRREKESLGNLRMFRSKRGEAHTNVGEKKKKQNRKGKSERNWEGGKTVCWEKRAWPAESATKIAWSDVGRQPMPTKSLKAWEAMRRGGKLEG